MGGTAFPLLQALCWVLRSVSGDTPLATDGVGILFNA